MARLVVRVLGLDLLDIDLSTDSPSPEPDDTARDLSGGTTCTNIVGFTASPGDQRWEKAPDLE